MSGQEHNHSSDIGELKGRFNTFEKNITAQFSVQQESYQRTIDKIFGHLDANTSMLMQMSTRSEGCPDRFDRLEEKCTEAGHRAHGAFSAAQEVERDLEDHLEDHAEVKAAADKAHERSWYKKTEYRIAGFAAFMGAAVTLVTAWLPKFIHWIAEKINS